MNKIEKIKAAQVAAAQKEGDKSPYELAHSGSGVSTRAFTRIEVMKQQQMDAAADAGETNPYGAPLALADDGASHPLDATTGASFDILQAAMDVHLARIKGAKTLAEKAAIKAELITDYLAFVNDYVSQAHDYPNSIAVQVCIWLFDLKRIEAALKLGFYLLKTPKNDLPPKFNRDLQSFMGDELYDWANEKLKAEQGASPYLDQWVMAIDNNNDWDLHPLIISKNLAMLAKHRLREGQHQACVDLCDKAEQANPQGAGVKTLKAKALKLIPVTEATSPMDEKKSEPTDTTE